MFADRHHGSGFAVFPIALDAFPERVKVAVAAFDLSMTVLIDESNQFGRMYGFNVVPAAFLVSASGAVAYEYKPKFDPLIDFGQTDAELLADVERLISTVTSGAIGNLRPIAPGAAAGLASFQRGVELHRAGRVSEAIKAWREAATLEPDNMVWRNHLWRALYPERFEIGDIDLPWQNEQLVREAELGIEAANPIAEP